MTNMLIDFISLLIIFLTSILLPVSQGRHSALMAINISARAPGQLFAIVIGILTNMSYPDAIGPAFSIACICQFDFMVFSKLQGLSAFFDSTTIFALC